MTILCKKSADRATTSTAIHENSSLPEKILFIFHLPQFSVLLCVLIVSLDLSGKGFDFHFPFAFLRVSA